ncbi:uncharacterized protein LOC131171464 [Hevea brasiliensis]|uniref:uncharacterized protein LOC131171464 n=1 Tax=Hevea brasiliensis TaxID=3981 RepID=UPI0025F15677|nr:uncharacterized protein LOC131171464 [Hevea brasiliensis]
MAPNKGWMDLVVIDVYDLGVKTSNIGDFIQDMALDKSWMGIENRKDPRYIHGVKGFLTYTFRHESIEDAIPCPCLKCRNVNYKQKFEVRYHLLKHGMLKSYTIWYFHGESLNEDVDINDDPIVNDDQDFDDDMIGLVNDIYRGSNVNIGMDSNEASVREEPKGDATTFYHLLREAKEKLHPECELSKLAAIVKLLHMKSFHRWTNRSFDDLLGLLRKLIPNGKQNLPESYSSARKYVSGLGLHYEKYDVCQNHCTLYWGSFANATSCQICGLSRWKSDEGKSKRKKTPYKVLRYFPLKPRLQKLFMSSQHGSFASDARNVRLELAIDGFQPFRNMSSQHSIWPVILIPYNLPPWICMKQTNLMMSMIIPELWEVGVETYDAHSKKNFTLHAAIIWTISDFLAYGDLSGWSTKGYKACPACHKYTSAKHLAYSKKMFYMDHRRFLPPSHKWRKDTKSFNGFKETRAIPKPLSGDEVLMELEAFTQMPFNRGIKRKYDASNSFEN